MVEFVLRALTIPRLSKAPLLAVGVVLTFLWLLAHDQIHPFAIYLAQVYLMF